MPIRFLINQCQIITFLILKYDIIENSRIELRRIVFAGTDGWIIGGGGAKGMLAPPLKLLGGAWPPLPTPMHIHIKHEVWSRNHMVKPVQKTKCRSLRFINTRLPKFASNLVS